MSVMNTEELQTALAAEQSHNRELSEQVEKLTKERDALRDTFNGTQIEVSAAREVFEMNARRTLELRESQSQCSALREALEKLSATDVAINAPAQFVRKALSTTAGADLLKRLTELEALNSAARIALHQAEKDKSDLWEEIHRLRDRVDALTPESEKAVRSAQ